MSVKARFWVQGVDKRAVGNSEINRIVTLAPVIRAAQLAGGDDNKSWSKYTPSGEIKLTVTAIGAGQWFEDRIGKDVAITFDDVTD